jgi:Peptidase C39 family
MSVDLVTQQFCEPIVSCDTVLPCLVRAGICRGDDPEIESFRQRVILDGNTLPASRLIEFVGELGVRAECMRLDWSGLTNNALSYSVLVFLKNTNAVVVTGTDSAAVEAVTVWDPLHDDGELAVRREDFERAWDGDALVIARQMPTTVEPGCGSCGEQSPELPDARPASGSEQAAVGAVQLHRTSAPVARPVKSRLLVAIGLAAAASLCVLLWVYGLTDTIGTAGLPLREQVQAGPGSTAASAEAAAHPNGPDTAASERAGAMPQTASIVTKPDASEPPGEPASAPAPIAPATSPEPALASVKPAPAEPSNQPELPATPEAAFPSEDISAAPPATGAAAAQPRLSPADGAALVARGDILFSTGDLAAARLFYERAADAGEAQAAIRLGETFDPSFLEQAHLHGVRGNVETALSWYRRARDLGATEAEFLLNSLESR